MFGIWVRGEMANATALRAVSVRSGGSSPSVPTSFFLQ